MNEPRNERPGKFLNRQNEQSDKLLNRLIIESTNEGTDKLLNRQMNSPTNEQTD
jgi:hypothetical protein